MHSVIGSICLLVPDNNKRESFDFDSAIYSHLNDSLFSQHLVLDVARVFDGFIYLDGATSTMAGQSPATKFFEWLCTKKYIATSCLYVVTTCVGDAFIVRINSTYSCAPYLTFARYIAYTSSGEGTSGSSSPLPSFKQRYLVRDVDLKRQNK